METMIYSLTGILYAAAEKQELTQKILEQDKDAYIDSMFPLDIFVIIFGGLVVAAIVGLIVSIVFFKKNRKAGADAAYLIRFIGSAIACGAATLTFAGMFAMMIIATVFPRWILDQKINVNKTVITHKYIEAGSTTTSEEHVSTSDSYILSDDEGEKYSVTKNVYDNVELGGEYYCARLGSMNNCFNIYDTDEYVYNK